LATQASNIVPLVAMQFLGPRAVPVFVTILLLMAAGPGAASPHGLTCPLRA